MARRQNRLRIAEERNCMSVVQKWVSASITIVLCNRFLWMVFRQIAAIS